MAAKRYYYFDTISSFLGRKENEIVGELTLASQHDINEEMSQSWVEEIKTLRDALLPYSGRGSLFFEYNIPRMGRRADVIAVIDGVVLCWNTKRQNKNFIVRPRSRCGILLST